MARRKFTDSKIATAAARDARTGNHGPTSGHLEVKREFEPGERVELKNGQIAHVKEKTSWGDYELEEFPGQYFSWRSLLPVTE